jgi:hypothetical protein
LIRIRAANLALAAPSAHEVLAWSCPEDGGAKRVDPLFTTSEVQILRRLRTQFDKRLPHFDYLAQLHRYRL